MTTLPDSEDIIFKGRHFDQSVILLCIRWYLAYGLSLCDLEEMMAERGVAADHSTVNRWVRHISPVLMARFNRRKRTVSYKWHLDETYIKVRGQWMYLCRAIDSMGDTVEFWFSEHRELAGRKAFSVQCIGQSGTAPSALSSMEASRTGRGSSLSILRTVCRPIHVERSRRSGSGKASS